MAILRCPTCQREFDSTTAAAVPFCSSRCRQIDLNRWLQEEHSLPVERDEEDEEPPPDGGYEGNRLP